MQNFYADIDTKVTFNQLDGDGCEIECTVHSKKGHLFYDAVRDNGGIITEISSSNNGHRKEWVYSKKVL